MDWWEAPAIHPCKPCTGGDIRVGARFVAERPVSPREQAFPQMIIPGKEAHTTSSESSWGIYEKEKGKEVYMEKPRPRPDSWSNAEPDL